MRGTQKLVAVLVLVASMTACAEQGGGGKVELLTEVNTGEGPVVVAPTSAGTAEGGAGVIVPSGTSAPAPTGEAVPGTVEGGVGEGSEEGGSEGEGPAVGAWLTYTDAEYGFSCQYPDSYAILPEPDVLPESSPETVHRVRFLERELAASDLAELEPPKLSIEVYEMHEAMPLRDWLTIEANLPQDAAIEEVQLPAAGAAWRVTLQVMLAPNQFYYLVSGNHVLKLTPLGADSDLMLASFQLAAR